MRNQETETVEEPEGAEGGIPVPPGEDCWVDTDALSVIEEASGSEEGGADGDISSVFSFREEGMEEEEADTSSSSQDTVHLPSTKAKPTIWASTTVASTSSSTSSSSGSKKKQVRRKAPSKKTTPCPDDEEKDKDILRDYPELAAYATAEQWKAATRGAPSRSSERGWSASPNVQPDDSGVTTTSSSSGVGDEVADDEVSGDKEEEVPRRSTPDALKEIEGGGRALSTWWWSERRRSKTDPDIWPLIDDAEFVPEVPTAKGEDEDLLLEEKREIRIRHSASGTWRRIDIDMTIHFHRPYNK